MNKEFKKWFDLYGLQDDHIYGASTTLRRIAWRAYKRGVKVGRELGPSKNVAQAGESPTKGKTLMQVYEELDL